MPRLRENDRERAVGMVQAAYHFNVSRITISWLMIRLRQTGRTNDRPRVCGRNVTTDNYALFTSGTVCYRICHQIEHYGMNSVTCSPPSTSTRNTTGAAWRTCARLEQHPTSIYPTIDWFYASEMRSCRCCKRWSRMLLNSQTSILHDNICLSIICSDNDVEKFCWIALFVMSIWI